MSCCCCFANLKKISIKFLKTADTEKKINPIEKKIEERTYLILSVKSINSSKQSFTHIFMVYSSNAMTMIRCSNSQRTTQVCVVSKV